jgi:hypothetical protein
MRSPSSLSMSDGESSSGGLGGGQIVVTQRDGRQQVRGTGFLDRLMGATDITTPSLAQNYRMPSSFGLHHYSSTRRLGQLGSPALSHQTKASSMFPSSSLHSPVDSDTDAVSNDDDDDVENQSDEDTASTGLVSIGRRRPAQLRWKHEEEVSRIQHEIDAATREGSVALKHLRVGSQSERTSVARVFEDLHRVEMKDTERVEVKAAIQGKRRKYYGFVSAVIAPSSALLQSIWDHRRVGNLERASFSEKYFLQDAKNFVAINQEIAKYQRTSNSDLELLRLAGLRETILSTLRSLLSSPALCDPHTPPASAEVLAIDVFNGVLQLRFVTCEIVDVVMAKREAEGIVKAQPLLWEGENYLMRMQNDVAPILSNTNAFVLLGEKYPCTSNPMVLPADLRNPSSPTRARERDCPAKEDNHAPSTTSAANPAKGCPPAPMPQRASTPSASKSTASVSKSTAVNVVKPGELLDSSGDRSFGGGNGLPPQAGITKHMSVRNVFFKRQLSAMHRANTKIAMDRSNVYQYPSSVYQPVARPVWARVGEMLQRSLDPRVRSSGYNDIQEYERLQFGRITTPPSFFTPWKNPVVDEASKCFRTVIPDHQRYSAGDLHRREVIIFGEQAFTRSQRLRRRFHKGTAKLSMAYRGFIVMLQNRRRGATASVDDFLRWVAQVCPEWLDEARRELSLAGGGDDAVAQQIFSDDIEDDA